LGGGVFGCDSDAGHEIFPENDVISNRQAEHSLRIFSAREAAFQHNYLRGAGRSRLNIKMHSGGGAAIEGPYIAEWDDLVDNAPTFTSKELANYGTPGKAVQTRWICIGYNKLSSSTGINSWSIAVGPQNKQSNELVWDVVVEFNNFIERTSIYQGPAGKDIHVGIGQRTTVRGSTKANPTNWTFGSLIEPTFSNPYDADALADLYTNYNGPFYTDASSSIYSGVPNNSVVTAISPFIDPGKPTGAA
jgi:hypothetical protein